MPRPNAEIDHAVTHTVKASPRTLTTWKIIVLIIGTLTPLSFMAGMTPLALQFGGPSVPFFMIVAATIMGLFCVGYVQMVRRISRPGAYYSYIARGMGRHAGVGAAYIGVVTYVASLIAIYAVTAFTIAATFPAVGLPETDPVALFPWVFLVQAALVGLLVWRQIDLSALVSGVIVLLEVVIILAFVAVTIEKGGLDFAAFGSGAFSPSAGHWAVAFIFAFLSFHAFESGALYAPEARNPEKTVPRALFGALIILTVTSVLATWGLISYSTVDTVAEDVASGGGVGYVLASIETALGTAGLRIFSVILILATVVATLGITNFTARYLNGLARDDLLPAFFARTNTHGAPAATAYVLIGLAAAFSYGCMLINIEPYTQLTPVGFGLATVGTTTLLWLSSIAVVIFFRRLPSNERHWWGTATAPALRVRVS